MKLISVPGLRSSGIRGEEALVPSLWRFQVRNILIVNERRHRIAETATATFLSAVARLPVREDHSGDEAAVLRLARAHQLSIYEAAYLELSQRDGLPLTTLDVQLQQASVEAGIVLLGARGWEAAG